MSDLLKHGNANAAATHALLKNYMIKTINDIVEIVDVSVMPIKDGNTNEEDSEQNNATNNASSEEDDPRQRQFNGAKAKTKTTPDLLDPSRLESCSREDITTFVAKLCKIEGCDLEEKDIQKLKIKGKF